MTAAFDGYRGLGFAPMSDGRLRLALKSKSLREVPLRELSAGTLRYMCLVTLLATSDLPTLLWTRPRRRGFIQACCL